VPAIWVLNERYRREASHQLRKLQETWSRLTSTLAESVSGIRVTQAFVRQEINAGFFRKLVNIHGENNVGLAHASAVFIPLLFMTGIIGRLFREFAMTLTYSIIVSAIISLTLTPMMCGRLLKAQSEEHGGGLFFRLSEGGFKAMLRAYEWSLRIVLRHERLTQLVALATLVATVWLYIQVPKGFLPQQDTGLIVATTDADQSISVDAMSKVQSQVAEIARRDPDVAGVDSFIGAGTINTTPNTGHITIVLKPHDERHSSGQQVMQRLRDAFHGLQGIAVSLQLVQDIQLGARVSRTQ
jgi:multidrug efflux pump